MDIRLILNNKSFVEKKLSDRGFDISIIADLYQKAQKRNSLRQEIDELLAQKNKTSKQIGLYVRENKDAEDLKNQVSQIKDKLANLETEWQELDDWVSQKILEVPNLPDDSVPFGNSELDNQVIYHWGQPKKIDPKIKPHYEFGKSKNILDFKRAVKISGNRFVIYKNLAAKLVRALINFMIDTHVNSGYQEIVPNTLVLENSLYGTGQLPKFSEDLYSLKNSDLWLIPTAEVPLTNYYQDEIIDLEKPISLVGYSKCYRSEAGSGGKDTRGLIRLHEFHKVELVKITNEVDGIKEFDNVVQDAAKILKLLNIPYRAVLLCSGDLGFSSKKTIDLEAWLPSEQTYREVSSISYCGDFQARRAKIRYRDEKNNVYAHTINGSGLAIDRIVAILLEQNQNPDGSWTIPEVLKPYFN
ncbi:serine--tRNA ligase [Mesomycoplasma ovipneumoniae]|uniref:Serine--tRNA ligase n=1 Tax=Mesomycoplasma ovipneumoniae TaxID=29562 RepID=A0AAP6CVY2_9BACT|nr:serine--tRNA ligase [Mesomycoplasma ovipneumoniae]MCN0158302.1 serine--tRNA ligase [Mesomycoplasma ovipneumoniae]MDW2910009.1 serine--tRNA ligase [Mesomycoplasma ovipneumoniae]MDW2910825.1 serine--tRNA ligase [Mesomycoplasma ovipneumoniae]MDW2912543.1 serine--tRNA ligase [Mesomycoplasma ovipneumoniae]MDW2914801.1 serine--tRNA ligase [Mesomycoplasma ovipneumoniae]